MLGLEIGFDKPWYLVLLTVLPVLWMMSFEVWLDWETFGDCLL